MEKILFLGGSHFQVPAIKMAKKLGYYIITCDYLPDNPGHKYSDEYHNISTTDIDKILSLAKKLQIDGIVAYASDPAAIPAAKVAEKLNLPTTNSKAIETLALKHKFRKFLTDNDFNTPYAISGKKFDDVAVQLNNLTFPVVVKPIDSSGSKGVTVVENIKEIKQASECALSFSRNNMYIIEEYIEKKGYQIAGDGFVYKGELVFYCFANEHFNKTGNILVPIGESFPYIRKELYSKVAKEVQRLLTLLNYDFGAINFDIRIDKNDNVILMEIGPRNGGNLISQVIKYATGIDLVQYTLDAAIGKDCSALKQTETDGFYSCYMIHSQKEGIFKGEYIHSDFQNNILEKNLFVEIDAHIDVFNGSNGTLGTLILKFDSQAEMLEKMDNMANYYHLRVA
ncbi:MAG: ATP-grasp domain-containing protein [Alphaproteobacteria bacterium]|nr:ATP-grasp domain-containing protein [Alphaproteobacteria bacterium]